MATSKGNNMYAIRKTQNFFGPSTIKTYVTDGFRADSRAEFATKREALACAYMLDDAAYYTAHNESGRAEYRVVRVRNA